MPRGVQKQHLPSKVCVVCQRPFTWRKKWEQVWDEVTTCSKSCNRKRRANQQRQRRTTDVMAQNTSNDDSCSHQGSHVASPTTNHATTHGQDLTNLSLVKLPQALLGLEETNNVQFDNIAESGNGEDNDKDADVNENESQPSETKESSPASSNRLDNDDNGNDDTNEDSSAALDTKAARKAAKKAKKALRRAQREGRADSSVGQKACTVCGTSCDLLIRCQIDASQQWHMVCGKCWNRVSGGVVDGSPHHPHYRYGGLWKNRAKRA